MSLDFPAGDPQLEPSGGARPREQLDIQQRQQERHVVNLLTDLLYAVVDPRLRS
jgi:hypothetical protein